MKALMRSDVFWLNTNKEIEGNVKSCRGCAITAKVPPVKFTPSSKLHINFAGPLKGQYHLIVVESFSKWPEVMKCKNPMCSCTIRFLHKLFVRFVISDTIVSDDDHHHVMPLAQISLTLSRHFSLSFITSSRSSRLHSVSSHSCCMYVRAGRPAFAWPYAGVGTQFMAKELRDSCKNFSIVHITTTPYHLQFNGQAERFEDTLN